VHGTTFASGWDDRCVALDLEDELILTAPPAIKGTPTFPVIHGKPGKLKVGPPKAFQNTDDCTTTSVLFSYTFAFMNGAVAAGMTFEDNSLAMTEGKEDVLVCPCFPCILLGKQFYDSGNYEVRFHKGLQAGLSENYEDDECISKYGSVESAKLHIEFNPYSRRDA
jgi:hypothetical protein